MKKIYLDHAATTPVDSRVFEAMLPFFSEKYGNPSSAYSFGQEARKAVEESREKVAKLINATSQEIIFTSGGTEANNFALKGAAFANKEKGKHIITSVIEHHAVLNPCKWLEKNGFEVTYLSVDRDGMISLEKLKEVIRKDTILISIMHANNEIGTINPIEEIGKIAREHGVYFHTDAVQTVGKIPVDVEKMNIDLLSASAHKLYGPKGVGTLFIKRGVKITPLTHGGGHERNLRSGTENVPSIAGFGNAAEIAGAEMRSDAQKLIRLRNRLIDGALKIENSWLNGHQIKRLPNNAHFTFRFIEGESLILELDFNGIFASTGSACSSKSLEPSHVLTGIGLKPEDTHGSLRMTLGRQNTEDDINCVLEVLPNVVEKLRKISPFKKNFGEYEEVLRKNKRGCDSEI